MAGKSHQKSEQGARGFKDALMSIKLMLVAIGFGAIFWVVESAMHVFMFHEGNLTQQIFSPEAHEIWMRLLVTAVVTAFAIYAQYSIDQRKQAEDALRESESRHRALVEHIPAITYVAALDDASTTLYISPQVESFLGFSQPEYNEDPDTWRKQLHPDDRDRVMEEVARSHDKDTPFISEYRMFSRDGRVVWIHDEASIVCEPSGKPLRLQGVMYDITERKQAEEETARQNNLLNAINKVLQERLTCDTEEEVAQTCLAVAEELTGSKFGFIGELNPAGLFDTIAISNPGWDACKMPDSDAVRAIKNMEIRGIDRSVLGEGKPRIVNEPASHPDRVGTPEGHPPISSFLGLPLKHAGKTLGMIGLANKESGYDLADQHAVETLSTAFVEALNSKRAEEALRASEARFRTVADYNYDWEYWIDPDGRHIYVSPSCERMTGYGFNEFMEDPKLLESITHPADHAIISRHLRSELESRKVIHDDFRIITWNGDERWISHSCQPVYSEDGRYLGRRASNCDITERKRTEDKLRLFSHAVDSSIDGIAICNVDDKVIYVNDAFVKMWGYSREESMGKGVAFFCVGDDIPKLKEVLKQTTRGGWTGELVGKRKDGESFPMAVSSSRVVDDKGNLIAHMAILKDVTERKYAEEEKKELEAQLRQAQKMEAIGTLAGGIAHDFNNILTPIIGQTQMALLDIADDSPIRFSLQEVVQAGHRAKDLVKQILTFSRQREQRQMPLKLTPVAKEVVKLLRSTLPATIEIRQNMKAESDTIFAEPTQMHQVLMNLCTNAAHAMRETGGVLEVGLSDMDFDAKALAQYPDLKAGAYVKLTVADTGHGMEREVMNRVFDPFYTTKAVGEGTGMGLSVAHGIVKAHGGTITVDSEPGKGTTLNVFLPTIASEVSLQAECYLGRIPKGNERILLVDDEAAVVHTVGPMLEHLGYEVVARTSSIEALEAFRAQPDKFDLVITDLAMPNMTGDCLAQELRQIRPDEPVVLCTGFSELIDEDKAKAIGIDGYVMKPIVMEDIAETIREVLDR